MFDPGLSDMATNPLLLDVTLTVFESGVPLQRPIFESIFKFLFQFEIGSDGFQAFWTMKSVIVESHGETFALSF